MDRFYKAIADIESLYKAEIAGSLSDYFIFPVGGIGRMIFTKDLPTEVRNRVIAAAHEFLN